jgi:hypothetical protein
VKSCPVATSCTINKSDKYACQKSLCNSSQDCNLTAPLCSNGFCAQCDAQHECASVLAHCGSTCQEGFCIGGRKCLGTELCDGAKCVVCTSGGVAPCQSFYRCLGDGSACVFDWALTFGLFGSFILFPFVVLIVVQVVFRRKGHESSYQRLPAVLDDE